MTQTAPQLSFESIKRFQPLDRLNRDDGEELLHTAMTIQLSPGTSVFDPGDASRRLYFLLEGEVELVNPQQQKRIITAGGPGSYQPFGAHLEDQKALIAHSDCTLVMFDADMLELFLSWTNSEVKLRHHHTLTQNREVVDRLLQSRGLLRFSESQIKNLLNHMREIRLDSGDTVIRQHDLDDYYYIIKHGRCEVSRQPEQNGRRIKLAELGEGETFGEEALLTNKPRNATVTMTEPGALMRLAKEDFARFLADPLLNTLSWDEGQALIRNGAVIVDVRPPEEYEENHLPGSINIPLALLRLRVRQFSDRRQYILYCNDGSHSAVAAFLLSQNGFDAYMLDGGLSGSRGARLQRRPQEKASRDHWPDPANEAWQNSGNLHREMLFKDSEAAALRHKTEAIETATQAPFCAIEAAPAANTPAPAPAQRPNGGKPNHLGKKTALIGAALMVLAGAAIYTVAPLQHYLLAQLLPDKIKIAGYEIGLK